MGVFEPLWKTDNIQKKEEAVKAVSQITDEQKLRNVVLQAPLSEVSMAALEKISDPRILKEIILAESPAFEIKHAAVSRLSDPADLAEIAVQRKAYPADGDAIAMLDDEEMLFRIAMSEQGWEQSKAVYKIRNPQKLAEIAARAEKGVARKTAIRTLEDPGALIGLIRDTGEVFIRAEVFRRVDALLQQGTRFTDEQKDFLLQVILSEKNREIPINIERFRDKQALERIAFEAEREDLRLIALKRLVENGWIHGKALAKALKQRLLEERTGQSTALRAELKDKIEELAKQNIKSDPELAAELVRDPFFGPETALEGIRTLFGQDLRDSEGIEQIRRQALSAFVENIPHYREQDPGCDRNHCLRELAAIVPPGEDIFLVLA